MNKNNTMVVCDDPSFTISSADFNQFEQSSQTTTNYTNTPPDNSNNIKNYSKSEKKIIASRISQINNKKIYIRIFKIIHINDNKYTLCNDGVFLNINNLSNDTLSKIEHVLDVFDKIKLQKTLPNKWSKNLDNQYTNNNNSDSIIDDKFNNQEKLFLKRQQTNNDENLTYWS